MFFIICHFHPSLFAGKARSQPLRDFLHLGRLQPLQAILKLGWKQLTVTNVLAYGRTEIITDVKSFIPQAVIDMGPMLKNILWS